MMARFSLIFLMLSFKPLMMAQVKPPLSEDAYFNWKTIEGTQISNDGNLIIYEQNPNRGDGQLMIYHVQNKTTKVIKRGKKAHLDQDNLILICVVSPPAATLDSLRRRKVDEEDLPKDTLLLVDLVNNQTTLIPSVSSYNVGTKWHGWLFYQFENGQDSLLENSFPRRLQEDESILLIHSLSNNKKDTIAYVENLVLADESPRIFIQRNSSDTLGPASIICLDLLTNMQLNVYSSEGTFKNLSPSGDGKLLGFLEATGSVNQQEAGPQLYIWQENTSRVNQIEPSALTGLDDGWIFSSQFKSYFSKDGTRFFFGTMPPPLKKDSTMLPSEIVDVEIWTYQDQVLYTQQEANEEVERDRSYLCVYDVEEKTGSQLGSLTIPEIIPHPDHKSNYVIGLANQSSRMSQSWEGRIYQDVYLISLEGHKSEKISTSISGNPTWSSTGAFLVWHEEPDTTWYLFEIDSRKIFNLTQRDKQFFDEQNDMPDYPNAYGLMGWTENDSALYIYDRYDIWKIEPYHANRRTRITKGREDQNVYRYLSLDPDLKYVPDTPWFIRGFNEVSKEECYAEFNPRRGKFRPLIEGEFQLSHTPLKAKNDSAVIFTKETFSKFPDLLWSPDLKFRQVQRISEANPQQRQYNWGTIESVHWISPAGESLEGILVKPEDFDPSKKYPMIVNFYERNSHRLHEHHVPAPGRSTINYSYYASNGYVVFNPDVIYRTGYPGQSAYDAVISGTKTVVALGFIDTSRIALQGHSWGGYQIADILTKTNMFACAEAGAPVVNMISAYGGIRWSTGLSRMFQYERTQSRLGASLWERPDLYLENSPIFRIDKIETPVLILHNDEDGAVPWYQGIEFFVAMRRLQKPAWLLNYNGEPHWPVKWQNKLDFNRRLFQFFEHYLKDAPMPLWMKEGVPVIKKGIIDGLELSEEPKNK